MSNTKNFSKSLHNTDTNTAQSNVKDIIFWGNGDTFKLISKASSEKEGWMKSTKAMVVEERDDDEILSSDVVLQVTTQQRNPDGSYSVAEALTTIDNATIVETKDEAGNIIGRKVVKFY